MMEMPAAAAVLRTDTLPENGLFSLLRQSISAHAIFIIIVVAYNASFLVLLRLRPDIVPTSFLLATVGFIALSMVFIFLCVFIMRFYHIARYVKPERPLPALVKDIKQFLTNKNRLTNGIPMVLIMMCFMYVFANVKAAIPILNPLSWDTYFSELDAALHFGTLPWLWLQPLLGYAPITFLININYNLWFLVTWMMWVHFAFADRPSELRTRFFLSFFALWIIVGSLLAIAFSSAGPCFYGRLGFTPDPYADLMTYLRGVNETYVIWAIPLQDELWQGYVDPDLVLKGISAMPSMHNGSALLFALAGYQVSRFAGHLLSAHAILIFIGSIHLGWHYAVDSYLAWALTLVIWFAVAPVSRWWHSTAAQGNFDRALAAGV
ncbi:MAG TPA: phosphatase PAP2 family protein [Aestuariivirga sp.]|nr:phosphatase PAP2 family protein [Aestuariivirga sp.]